MTPAGKPPLHTDTPLGRVMSKRKITSRELARRAGVSVPTIDRFRAGRTPSLATAAKVASALKVKLEKLIP